MRIKQFETPGLSQYAYVVSSGSEAIVIDPMRDFEPYLQYAAEHDLKICYVTETHIHADFASGALSLANATGAELLLSAHDQGERFQYTMAHRPLWNGDDIRVGRARLQILHTPGHTPEHVSFILFDAERNSLEPAALFSGDFLFIGSLGRPDLLGDDERDRLAHELYTSLHERIASLADGVVVYPGHGAGSLCGTGMSQSPTSTVGYERRTQTLLALDEEQFIAELLSTVPPTPGYYARMKELNSHGARDYRDVKSCALSDSDLQKKTAEGSVTILDLRRPEAFGGAHIPGALNIGAGQNLSLWAGWMVDPEVPVVLVSETGDISDPLVSLLRVGLDCIEGHLRNGIATWIEAGHPIDRTNQLSARDIVEGRSEALVVDVRNQQEWNKGHIMTARHFALGDLPKHLHELPTDRPLITVCGTGYRSSIAASLLQAAGFSDTSSMDGGMTAWNKQLLPVS